LTFSDEFEYFFLLLFDRKFSMTVQLLLAIKPLLNPIGTQLTSLFIYLFLKKVVLFLTFGCRVVCVCVFVCLKNRAIIRQGCRQLGLRAPYQTAQQWSRACDDDKWLRIAFLCLIFVTAKALDRAGGQYRDRAIAAPRNPRPRTLGGGLPQPNRQPSREIPSHLSTGPNPNVNRRPSREISSGGNASVNRRPSRGANDLSASASINRRPSRGELTLGASAPVSRRPSREVSSGGQKVCG
jgi:hypothetical protein